MIFCPKAFLMPLNSMIGSLLAGAMAYRIAARGRGPKEPRRPGPFQRAASVLARLGRASGYAPTRARRARLPNPNRKLVQDFFELELDRVPAAVAIGAQLADDVDLAGQRAGAVTESNAERADARAALEFELELQVPTTDLTRREHAGLKAKSGDSLPGPHGSSKY